MAVKVARAAGWAAQVVQVTVAMSVAVAAASAAGAEKVVVPAVAVAAAHARRSLCSPSQLGRHRTLSRGRRHRSHHRPRSGTTRCSRLHPAAFASVRLS